MVFVSVTNESYHQIIFRPPQTFDDLSRICNDFVKTEGELYFRLNDLDDKCIVHDEETYQLARELNQSGLRLFLKGKYEPPGANRGRQSELRCLMLGLDESGKTTLMYKLKLDEIVTTIPTIGFNVETVVMQDANLTMWDVGGQDKIRPLWRHYLQATHILIYVVDAQNQARHQENITTLKNLMTEDELRGVALLVLLNKYTFPNAMPLSKIVADYGLADYSSNPVHCAEVDVLTSKGVIEAFSEIIAKINNSNA